MTHVADSPGVHIPPPLFYVAAIGGGALLKRWAPFAIGWDVPRVIAAWTCIALFAALLAWSYAWFASKKTALIPNQPATTLIVEGPFRLTRNPLYIAITLMTIGAGLWLNTWWVLILAIPAVAITDRYVIAREEAYLRRRFGPAYAAYTSRVRRWL